MVVVLSRFRVSNGMEAEVAHAFRARPRAVEQAPGFLWLEVFVDSSDPTLFYLLTRWTDLPSFEAWHHSPAHRGSHAFIPRGLKLDATWTQVYQLQRVDGVTGSPMTDAVADAALLFGTFTSESPLLHFLVMDRQGTIRTSNPVARRQLEPGATLEGRSIFDYLPDAGAARLAALLEQPRLEQRLTLNLGAVARQPITVDAWIAVHGDTVTLLGHPPTRHDQRLQDELMAISQDLAVLSRERLREVRDERQGREAAERLNRERNAFMTVLAHELRQPIGSALAAVGVLRKLNPDPALERPRALLERQLKQITRLVEDLSDTARIAAGDVHLRRARIDLARQLRELSTAWEAIAHDQHKSFTWQLPEQSVPVLGDVDRLQQIFSNLVGNAFKYTPPSGAVTLTAAIEDGWAVVTVADEGEGIPPERLPRIFELFQRATTTGSGLGVGLAVVHALVAAHGGTVTAASEGPGRGSAFTVRLPLAAPHATP
jgi:signal transduction histidine kinase/heme-degrading monooxygenase HmoA